MREYPALFCEEVDSFLLLELVEAEQAAGVAAVLELFEGFCSAAERDSSSRYVLAGRN